MGRTGDWTTCYPFRSRWLDEPRGRRDGRLHYIDEGEGDPLLFVHGPATWSFHWRGLIQAFRGRYRVIALDYTGCGLSGMPRPTYQYRPEDRMRELIRLIRQLRLRQITFVADGAAMVTALGVAVRASRRVARFVFIDPQWPSSENAYGLPPCPRGPWRVRTVLKRNYSEDASSAVRHGYLDPWNRWGRRCGLWRELCGWRRSLRSPNALTSLRERLSVFASYPACLIYSGAERTPDLPFVHPQLHVLSTVTAPVETASERLEPLLESFFEHNPVFQCNDHE